MLAQKATQLLGPTASGSHPPSSASLSGEHGPAFAVRVIGPQPAAPGSRTADWVQPAPQLLVGRGDGSLAAALLQVGSNRKRHRGLFADRNARRLPAVNSKSGPFTWERPDTPAARSQGTGGIHAVGMIH